MEDFSQALKKANLATEAEISQYRKEAFVVEADEETIDKWEKFMELEYKPDYSLQDRIDRVLYTLQARGSFTKEFLKNQGRLFLNGELEVEELFSQYHFIIRFTSIVGVPENIENFKDMVDLNKPAHLTYEFKFRYNTHGQLEILTHGEMEQYTHDELYQKRVFDDSQLPTTQNFLMKAVNTVKNAVESLIYPLKTDYYNVDIFNDNFRYLDEHKLEKGTYTGNADDLNDEISKVASPTQLGRVKVGSNLKIDEDGFLSGQDVDLSNYYDKPEIEEKFKNFCPFPVNSVFLTLGGENPHTLWLGTTWELQEGRFLLGSSSSYVLGSTGGSATTTLAKANLPAIKLQIDAHTHTREEHKHIGGFPRATGFGYTNSYNGTISSGTGSVSEVAGSRFGLVYAYTSSAGGTNTGSAAPYTQNMGEGTPFNNMPPYLVCNIWKRLT